MTSPAEALAESRWDDRLRDVERDERDEEIGDGPPCALADDEDEGAPF